MLKKAFIVITILLKCSAPVWAASPAVVISELQTGSKTSVAEEFVELYNATETSVNLDDWTLEYISAGGTVFKKAVLSGEIAPHGFYLLSSEGYLSQADAVFSVGLFATAGHVRINDGIGNVVDTLGWGATAAAAEAAPATKPAAGESLERLPGRLIEDGGNAVDTDDNSKDFVIRSLPLPQSTLSPPEAPLTDVPEAEAPTEELPEETDEPEPPAEEVPIYLPALITELWIDPPSPLKDTNDEFIELYNPHDEPVDLSGYVLKSGTNLQDYYVIQDVVMAPRSYYVFYASETHLSLTNTGGQAALLDPKGVLLSEVPAYTQTTPGYSWAQIAGLWAWSLEATPAAENVLVVPPPPPAPKAAAAKPKPAAQPKTVKATKPAVSKAKKPSTAKPKATKKAAAPAVSGPPKIAAVNTRHDAWLLIALVSLTIGYAIYELKSDLQNHYYLTRSKLRAWRENRPAASRRRND